MPLYLTFDPNEEPAIQYKGYHIEVSRVGKGWRACIYAPSATRPLADSPCNLEKCDNEEIVVEAERVIDAHLTRNA